MIPNQHTCSTREQRAVALLHLQMVPPRGSCSVKKMRMPQTIVPASIAADKTKLYLDHQSKLILRTRYSASPPTPTSGLIVVRGAGANRKQDEEPTKDKADDERRRKVDAGRGRDKLESGQGDRQVEVPQPALRPPSQDEPRHGRDHGAANHPVQQRVVVRVVAEQSRGTDQTPVVVVVAAVTSEVGSVRYLNLLCVMTWQRKRGSSPDDRGRERRPRTRTDETRRLVGVTQRRNGRDEESLDANLRARRDDDGDNLHCPSIQHRGLEDSADVKRCT